MKRMKFAIGVLGLISISTLSIVLLGQAIDIPRQRYQCGEERCVLQSKLISNDSNASNGGLNICRTTCGKYGSLWPVPTGAVRISPGMVRFNTNIQFDHLPANDVFKAMQENFINTITRSGTFVSNAGYIVQVDYRVQHQELSSMKLYTDESYQLDVDLTLMNKIQVNIYAANVFGARHALTTLSQLITIDESTNHPYIVKSASVHDKPAFTHRGLAIDTSRNFYPTSILYKLIKGMGENKLNTLHWHLSDTSSFSVELFKQPLITKYGAISPSQIYTQDDIRKLVAFGKAHGVRIVPELDAPAHAGEGWQWGPLEGKGELVLCLGKMPWENYCIEPPCGQFNVLNENLYGILQDVYEELNSLFDSDVFHMGGDEVHVGCWNHSKVITDYLEKEGESTNDPKSYFHLWGKFQKRAFELMRNSKKSNPQLATIWTSDLTKYSELRDNFVDTEKYVIQVWSHENEMDSKKLTEKGYKVIVSNYDSMYLDCGLGNWVYKGAYWCPILTTWQQMYDKQILLNITDQKQQELVLGGEVALWSESIDEYSIESVVWPRTAAMAERLWSNPVTDWFEADARMQFHRHRMALYGFKPRALQPLWCLQNQGVCSARTEPKPTTS